MVLVGVRVSVRYAAETFGLDYANLLGALGELDDAWRSCQTLKGQVVIMDDAVDHKEYSRGRDVSPWEPLDNSYWILPWRQGYT